MHEVKVIDNIVADGVDIWVTMKFEGSPRRILHFRNGLPDWDEADGTAQPPTMTLPDDAGRALLEQLLRHYAGSQDLHTVRADLVHERKRVDNLISALTQALAVTVQPRITVSSREDLRRP